MVKKYWYKVTKFFGLWDQRAAWWRYVLLGLTILFFLLSVSIVALFAQEEKKPWAGVEEAKEEKVIPITNYDRASLIVKLAVSNCWSTKGHNSPISEDGLRASIKEVESVLAYLVCTQGKIGQAMGNLRYGGDATDKAGEGELKLP